MNKIPCRDEFTSKGKEIERHPRPNSTETTGA